MTADRRRGEAASAAELRAAFGDTPGFVGVETVDDRPAARLTVDERASPEGESERESERFPNSVRIEADASAERDRPVGVELGTDSLTVAGGEKTRTTVTLTNVTDGVSALSLAANRTGEPAVRVRLRTDVNASRASASSHVSRDEMRTETTDLDGSDERGHGDWFDGVDNYNGMTVDATDRDEVTVTVGAEGNGGTFAFDPPAVRVDPGTTAVWEWSGDGGAHTVTAEGGTFDSGQPAAEEGTTFEHAFEEEGVYTYSCLHTGHWG